MAEYTKIKTARTIICELCNELYPDDPCEPADCDWLRMLEEAAVSVPQWISVKDKLPRDGEIVLCYTRWGFAVLQFDAEYHFWIDSNDCHSDSHILYWMKLPKAPKGDADNG